MRIGTVWCLACGTIMTNLWMIKLARTIHAFWKEFAHNNLRLLHHGSWLDCVRIRTILASAIGVELARWMDEQTLVSKWAIWKFSRKLVKYLIIVTFQKQKNLLALDGRMEKLAILAVQATRPILTAFVDFVAHVLLVGSVFTTLRVLFFFFFFGSLLFD